MKIIGIYFIFFFLYFMNIYFIIYFFFVDKREVIPGKKKKLSIMTFF
jgi:hypothetical protein